MKVPNCLLVVALACLLGAIGCKVKSANQPKTDAEALALVGVSMSPAPTVEYLHFQAGMDDHLELVIRFPKDRIAAFWRGSKWRKKDSQETKGGTPNIREEIQERLQRIAPGNTEAILESLRKSTEGIWAEGPGDSSEVLKLYISLDQDPVDVIAYIEWFQT